MTILAKPLNDKVREATKEALIDYILYLMPNPAYHSAGDLYGFFLIDVEMCTCMETSRLVQASAAVQLFVQRCVLNLESQAPDAALQILPSAFSPEDVTQWNQWTEELSRLAGRDKGFYIFKGWISAISQWARFIASTKLLGRMSVQVASIHAKHSARPPFGPTAAQPAGMSRKLGHKEY